MKKLDLEIELDRTQRLTRDLATSNKELCNKINELERRVIVYEADEQGLRETIGFLNKALDALNGVTP